MPIVITQEIVESVLRDLPDSPRSLEFSKAPNVRSPTGSFEAQPKSSISSHQRPRHIPIVIPNFAQPHCIFPPSPADSQTSTPRASYVPLAPVLPLTPKMSRPNTGTSQNSNLESGATGLSSNQLYAGRFKPTSHTYLSDMDKGPPSIAGTVAQDLRQHSEQAATKPKASATTPHSADPSPAIGTQPMSAATNLSGLVCNVHKCTGKEPHALVGATTTILGDRLYVFGGRKLSRRRPQLTSDLYELDLIRRHWTKVEVTGSVPLPRYFHSVCALGDSKLVCYGGMSPASSQSHPTPNSTTAQAPGNPADQQPEVVVMSDIHVFDVNTKIWTHVPTTDNPQGRYAHCATILPSSAVFTSANAPLSAMHHNPSSTNPNQGSIGVALDGTGGAEMVVVGGQDSANHYIEQISVFNLRSLKWTATESLGRSCGAYRSVVAPLTGMRASQIGIDTKDNENTEEQKHHHGPNHHGSAMLIYSNYNFLDVKLELQVRMPDGSLTERPMGGQFSPPGLRFPNGGVLDKHFVVSGTYLTSSKQEYALWTLDLKTLNWNRIDAGGSVFNQGSWNRGILWPRRNTFVILGNCKRSLVEDYNHRRTNFSNVCMVELEAFGLYDNPRRIASTSAYQSMSAPVLTVPPTPKTYTWTAGGRPHFHAAEELGQLARKLRELADMDLLTMSGERIPVNSHLLARRWGPYFINLLREGTASSPVNGEADRATGSDGSMLRPARSAASRNSSVTITPSIGTTYSSSTLTDPTNSSSNHLSPQSLNHNSTVNGQSASGESPSFYPPTPTVLNPSSRSRTLYLPHTPLTVHALLHFLYTSSLPPATHELSTPQILCSLLQIARPYRIDGLLEAVIERLHQVMDGRNAAAVFNASAMAAGGGRGTGTKFSELDNSIDPPYANGLIPGAGGESTNADIDSNDDHLDMAGGTDPDGTGKRGLRIDTSFTSNRRPPQQQQQQSGFRRAPDSHAKPDESEDEGSVVSDSTHTSNASSASASTNTNTDTDTDRSEYTGRGGTNGNGVIVDEEVWSGERSCVVGLQKRGLKGLMEGRRLRSKTGGGSVGAVSVSGGLGGAAPAPPVVGERTADRERERDREREGPKVGLGVGGV